MFSPETKVKRFLDSVAYFCLIGNTDGIETKYKEVMHAKREIPISSCPSFVENMVYASGMSSDLYNQEECDSFKVMTERLDTRAEAYESQKSKRTRQESNFQKYLRLHIHNGEWCRVDTDGVFEYNGRRYQIDQNETQYQPVDTAFGLLYDMDRILATNPENPEFYDMKYNKVKVNALASHD